MSQLYEKIEALTDLCGLSITEMCKQAGVTRSILSEFSAGRTKRLSTGTLVKICSFFGVTTDYMTGMADSDFACCPVCGYIFPLPDKEAAAAHSRYHERFEQLHKKYIYIYKEAESDRMLDEGGEATLMAKFSKSVLAHGDGHPDFDTYVEWLSGSDSFLFEPSSTAPKARYSTEQDDVDLLPRESIRFIPLYESASAGFGTQANSTVIDYMPLFIASDIEASNTMCIKVVGNSMYPKIEDGDIVQVVKTPSVDSGRIAIVLLDGEEGLIKRVVYGNDWIELQSINPEYAPRRFEGEQVQRIRVVGLVKRIIKEC